MGCAVARAAGLAKALVTGCVVGAAMMVTHAASAGDLRHSSSNAVRNLAANAPSRVGHNSVRNERHRRKHQYAVALRPRAMRPASTPAAAGGPAAPSKPKADFTGEQRLGVASFYADNFGGKPMADGVPMNLEGNNAASRTLPLGTKAKVTNLETGKSATVVIEDRGPYVDGRIVDLSPGTARKIGITRRQGISKVVVAPITVPQPDGTVKLGAAARGTNTPVREASLGGSVHAR